MTATVGPGPVQEQALEREVLAPAVAGRSDADDLLSFLRAYYRSVAPEDLEGRTPRQVLQTALAHRELARQRTPGQSLVRVGGTPGSPGAGLATGSVDVVTDDMPFLVDSLTAELTRSDSAVALVVHPRLRVTRDADGRLLDVQGDAQGEALRVEQPGGAGTESWIHLELAREPGPDARERLAADLQRVLGDVRAAVEDWQAMRALALDTAERLSAAAAHPPPGAQPADVEEVAELLRWLADDSFTFLGAVELGTAEHGPDGEPGPGTGLGLLRPERRAGPTAALAREVAERGRQDTLLVISKTGTRSSVHRPAHLDSVGVQLLDDAGRVVGERRFLGLLAAAAYTESVNRIPVVRRRVAQVLERSGYPPATYTGRELVAVLQTFPRDELFQTDVEVLHSIATSVLRLRERRQLRAFVRRDDFGRYLSVLVYLPRDRYTTRVRLALTRLLSETYDATSVDFTARVTESVLARLHFVVRLPLGQPLPDVDVRALERRLAAAARSWDDDLAEAAAARLEPTAARALLEVYGEAFPEAYKEDYPAEVGLADALRLSALLPDGLPQLGLRPDGEQPDRRRLVLYRDRPLTLTEVLPVLHSLGVDVLDERPYELRCRDGARRWVYDFGLRLPGGAGPEGDERLLAAVGAVQQGRAEVDGFNALVPHGLTWQQVVVLRALAAYLRQGAPTASPGYVQEVLRAEPVVAVLLVRLFEARLDPASAPSGPAGELRARELAAQVETALDAVEQLDRDRILRSLLAVVLATLRTNAYAPRGPFPADGAAPGALALKIDPSRVPFLPEPRPWREVFVYSPRVEGVHLRFGAVARGGLRWSDRREDFRTEVLGLVKAQMVKNAVIVPTGGKGGFVAKRLPPPTDRDAWLAEGVACYRAFVGSLLDVTDNLLDGQVVPPEGVVRCDGDDPYLVVAADKGTATFSDLANEVAASYGFWLGDAFASGGSAGYDHKAMGITARGAWESVKRHFRERGLDPQREPFTVVGIGDMSGDVFGNGMLLSEHLRLVAAFDHRHVFLDPDPDPASSYAERRRLFALPRSSWADYDPALLSEGGGVHPRTAKSIPVTPQVRARLGLPEDVTALPPSDLLRAVLTAPVDLLWNGGIGTYVKAAGETHEQVGDKANDAVRVDGGQLRARVVGEGGNLGLTQRGRIEYALVGGRVNTDAIDNSAGVDTSDHEVNFKILLAPAVRDGQLAPAERDRLLASLTDDVAALVLAHNCGQNLALGIARAQAPSMLPVHARLMTHLEGRGELDRELEHLPSPAVLEQRAAAGTGLTSSELAVLLAYAKITLSAQILDSRVPEDPWYERALRGYFPPVLVERFGDRLAEHRLRREITTTVVVNEVVDRGGITYVFRAVEETGATPAEVVRAGTVASEVLGLPALQREVEALGGRVPTAAQTAVHAERRRLLDRATRWLLQARRTSIDVAREVERFAAPIAELTPLLPRLLAGTEAERLARRAQDLEATGLPSGLALRTACLLDAFSLLDVVETAAGTGRPPEEVARLYFALSDRFDVDALLTRITALPRTDRWQALARSSLRYDLYAALAGLVQDVLRTSPPGAPPAEAIARWERENEEGLTRVRSTLAEVLAAAPDLATLSVALRTVRSLLPA